MAQQAEPQIKNEPMELEKKGTLADLLKQLSSLWYGLVDQGFWVSFLGLAEFFMRFVTGAPIQRLSQITPQLHISGQHQNFVRTRQPDPSGHDLLFRSCRLSVMIRIGNTSSV